MAETPPQTPIPILPMRDAVAFFRSKGLAKSFAWQDIAKAAHDFYFTVAKMMSISLLEDVRALIDAGIDEGTSPQRMRRDLKALLGERGWWGRQAKVDPLSGKKEIVQLGSDRRVRTIINTNLRTSYSAGRYARINRLKSTFPILVYKCIIDGRERDEHRSWNNVALLVSDPWWETHYPPCDWGCRCRTVSMTRAMAARRDIDVDKRPQNFGTRRVRNRRTGEVQDIERGIGAGWDYHPGKAQVEGLAPPPLAKFSTDRSEAFASASPSAVDRFLRAFGADAETGRIFYDKAGWPLPISKRWLYGLSMAEQNRVSRAAEVISNPDAIRLVWVRGEDGRSMLMRRYIRRSAKGFAVADIGLSGWRYSAANRISRNRLLESGTLAWSKEA